ncbi:CBF-domain-containing protein [Lentithecium fluviatile CBS 122367]|uniref:CBF-domain-containing protein n=1 Tax=Lentithecium fluviatile CBS 122367 TaxID=1168545 RepID=A0A6G1IWD3_9PLEO|nr:CBF-domain-containing protein [Lentithecium fluviatile CBS 122367]
MSGSKVATAAGVKRKRESSKAERRQPKSKPHRASSEEDDNPQTEITRLETQILESRKHYNNIATLLHLAKDQVHEIETSILAAVALCRVFTRLLSSGDMVKSKATAQSEALIVSWLKERYREYTSVLLEVFLRSEHASKQSVALTLLMRLVRGESKQKDYNWRKSPLPKIVETVLLLPEDDVTRDEFAEKFFAKFDDIRFYTFKTIQNFLRSGLPEPEKRRAAANSLSLLLSLDTVPSSKADIQDFYIETQGKPPIPSLNTYKEKAQEAWLATLRTGMSKEQRKSILGVFSHQIAPWFPQPEMLMDFLTDSYDVGGATSLLALSGLYYLISEKNLDYPSFYQKLYSLLDENLMHSKHRSRFFRLLDTFMSSTHLPATLVASFIKRLSRLALHAPPAGIVVVVPWVYNMFKRHPACTFMMHREIRDPETKKQLKEEGMDDPFDMDEQDPLLTDAIESSVWELESLQSHYHPNVATLAKVISEQFTKRSYNLEDFLDHSYTALLDTELGRDLKKDPEVEFEIPKRIFTTEERLNPLGQLWNQVIQA